MDPTSPEAQAELTRRHKSAATTVVGLLVATVLLSVVAFLSDAYLIEKIEERKLARLTNYGEFLEKCPPTAEVEIHVGNQATWMWKLRARYWRGRRADHDGSGSRESTIDLRDSSTTMCQ